MTAVDSPPDTQTAEYQTTTDLSKVKLLAREGWTVHTAVASGVNVHYLMHRPTGDTEARAVRFEVAEGREALLAQLLLRAGEREAALRAERDRLCTELGGVHQAVGELADARAAHRAVGSYLGVDSDSLDADVRALVDRCATAEQRVESMAANLRAAAAREAVLRDRLASGGSS